MNAARMIEKVIDVFDLYRPVASGLYSLFAKNMKLGLCQHCVFDGQGQEIAVLSSKDVNEGLRASTWEAIRVRLQELDEKGLI